jgi:hypothetical protein
MNGSFTSTSHFSDQRRLCGRIVQLGHGLQRRSVSGLSFLGLIRSPQGGQNACGARGLDLSQLAVMSIAAFAQVRMCVLLACC